MGVPVKPSNTSAMIGRWEFIEPAEELLNCADY
jgi:hypothetical protein